MQEYKIKNNGTKIEAFRQEIVKGKYILPMESFDANGKWSKYTTEVTLEVGEWLVKLTGTDQNRDIRWEVLHDKEFREKYEPVSAPAPHPLKNASQELQETLRRLEQDFQKNPWHECDRPQKFWTNEEIPNRFPYRSSPIWMCEHGLCEKFGQQ